MEDEEAFLEIAGLEPNQWTGTFVENLIPPKAKWYRRQVLSWGKAGICR